MHPLCQARGLGGPHRGLAATAIIVPGSGCGGRGFADLTEATQTGPASPFQGGRDDVGTGMPKGITTCSPHTPPSSHAATDTRQHRVLANLHKP